MDFNFRENIEYYRIFMTFNFGKHIKYFKGLDTSLHTTEKAEILVACGLSFNMVALISSFVSVYFFKSTLVSGALCGIGLGSLAAMVTLFQLTEESKCLPLFTSLAGFVKERRGVVDFVHRTIFAREINGAWSGSSGK